MVLDAGLLAVGRIGDGASGDENDFSSSTSFAGELQGEICRAFKSYDEHDAINPSEEDFVAS